MEGRGKSKVVASRFRALCVRNEFLERRWHDESNSDSGGFDEVAGVEMAFHVNRTLQMLGILGILLTTRCVDMRETIQEKSEAEKNLLQFENCSSPPAVGGTIQSPRSGGETLADSQEVLQNLNDVASPSDARTASSKLYSA
jgi:hypothetical protein